MTQIRVSHLSQNDSPVATYSFEQTVLDKKPKHLTQKIDSGSYTYVLQDAKRTLLVTSILIGLSLLLSMLIQNSIVKISYFGY